MGFWGTLGKYALKAAPIAAAFIPGVGPLASAAISAGTSAAQKKASGGSWKDALKAGAVGGATGYAGAKIPIKGIGPSAKSTDFLRGDVGSVASRLGGGGGFKGAVGNIAKGAMGQGGTGWQGKLGEALGGMARGGGGREMGGYRTPPYIEESGGFNPAARGGNTAISRNPAEGRFGQQMRRQLGPVMGRQDQSNPNLALALGAGRMEAIRNQPFRQGYDINTLGYDDETVTTSRMPQIYPTGGRRQGRKQKATQ